MTDRATILNFIIGLKRLHGVHRHRQRRPQQREIVTVPLDSDETMTVGWISNERARLSAAAETYLDRAARGHRQARLRTHRMTPSRTGRARLPLLLTRI